MPDFCQVMRLPFAVTQGRYWSAAVFRQGDLAESLIVPEPTEQMHLAVRRANIFLCDLMSVFSECATTRELSDFALTYGVCRG